MYWLSPALGLEVFDYQTQSKLSWRLVVIIHYVNWTNDIILPSGFFNLSGQANSLHQLCLVINYACMILLTCLREHYIPCCICHCLTFLLGKNNCMSDNAAGEPNKHLSD